MRVDTHHPYYPYTRTRVTGVTRTPASIRIIRITNEITGETTMREPSVTLTELREYRSQSGSTYFAGFLGKTRVVMLRDDRAQCTGKEVARWNLILEPAQPRSDQAAPAERKTTAKTPRRTQASLPLLSSTTPERKADRRAAACLIGLGRDPNGPDPSDEIPF